MLGKILYISRISTLLIMVGVPFAAIHKATNIKVFRSIAESIVIALVFCIMLVALVLLGIE